MKFKTEKNFAIQSDKDFTLKTDASIKIQSGKDFVASAEGSGKIKSTGKLTLNGQTVEIS